MISAGVLRLFRSGAADGIRGAGRRDGRPRSLLSSRLILWPAIVVAVGAGAATALGPLKAMLGMLGILLLVAVARWPVLAAYVVVALTPLTAGISTGAGLPLRPNEVLDVLVAGGLAVGGIARLRSGRIPRLRLDGVEWPVLLMAVFSSALPLLVMSIRQQQVSQDDLLYALVMWKLLAVYVIVRLSVRTGQQIRRCLWLSVAAASVVAVAAIAQSLDLFGISGTVSHYFAQTESGPAGAGARASSTLGLPVATADLLIFNLGVVSGLWTRYRRHRLILAAAAALFVAGTLAAGEISGYIGLAVGLVFIAIVTRSARLLALFIPAGLAGAGLLRAVIGNRLSGFHSPYGMPESWLGRLSNLRTYFWPQLFSHGNFVLGVRPAARVPVLTQNPGYIWIESGYTWLLWGGGIPLLASYIFFVLAAARRGWLAARYGPGAASVAGAAAFVAVLVTAVLMLFDMHLTYRGSADALFALVALAAPRPPSPRAARRGGIPGTSRTAWQGGSIVTPEEEARSGAPTAWQSTLTAGSAGAPREPAGSRAGWDGGITGVNPAAARRGPRAPDQLPRFLRAHWAGIVAIALAVTAGAALLAGLQPREYKSQAVVVVYPNPMVATAGTQAAVMGTEQAIALSDTVVRSASSRLHMPDARLHSGLSVSAPANSYLLNIAFTDPDPRVAQRNAQAIADAYVAYRMSRAAAPKRTTAGTPGRAIEDARVITPASPPAAPSSPDVGLDIGAGAILGVVLGLGFALARDRTDDRLRGPADLEARSGGRVLAVIPAAPDGPGQADGVAVLHSPGSPVTSAFRDLGTRVVQAAAWQDARTVLVASPEGEDEGLVSGNLAAALALAGQRVLLVCADPSRARIQERFGVTASTGLADVLDGNVSVWAAILPTEVPGLGILPAGSRSGDRAVMRASQLRGVMSEIRDRADFAIIDAPAVLTAPEPSVLAELADMVLLAADARNSTRTSVQAAARELGHVRPVLDGCVLTEARRGRLAAPVWWRWGAGRLRTAADRTAAKVPPPAEWRPTLIRLVKHGAEPDDDGSSGIQPPGRSFS